MPLARLRRRCFRLVLGLLRCRCCVLVLIISLTDLDLQIDDAALLLRLFFIAVLVLDHSQACLMVFRLIPIVRHDARLVQRRLGIRWREEEELFLSHLIGLPAAA